MTSLEQVAYLQQAILRDVGVALEPGLKVLDIGCGAGTVVRAWLDSGFDAFGCDLRFKKGSSAQILIDEHRIRLIDPEPYRLPFADQTFDVLVTNQVMEHVHDYAETIHEMRRVLKKDGVSLHMFPSRWRPIESHVGVPLASIIKSRAWLSLWALIGVRTRAQMQMNWRQVAAANEDYLRRATHYLTGREIDRHFRNHFAEVRDVGAVFLRHTPNRRGRMLYTAGRVFPVLHSAYRFAWSRTILAR